MKRTPDLAEISPDRPELTGSAAATTPGKSPQCRQLPVGLWDRGLQRGGGCPFLCLGTREDAGPGGIIDGVHAREEAGWTRARGTPCYILKPF